jgi:predicted enzyme related to lactoylglutathione lyase
VLSSSRVEANIPASDLKRARAFYEDTLGLEPQSAVDGVQVVYRTSGGTTFNLYETAYAGQAGHTIAQWHVDDIESEVRDLKGRGVTFQVYDLPGISWDGDIATLPDVGRAAWFTDSEGNIMCVDQVV